MVMFRQKFGLFFIFDARLVVDAPKQRTILKTLENANQYDEITYLFYKIRSTILAYHFQTNSYRIIQQTPFPDSSMNFGSAFKLVKGDTVN